MDAKIAKSFDINFIDGELYYIEQNDHFIIKIYNTLFHGNIGKIFTNRSEPYKIKNCKYTNGCTKGDNCNYYHDPLIIKSSTDNDFS